MTIVAPGNTAPLESVTRPTTSAVVTCAAMHMLMANKTPIINEGILIHGLS